MRVSNLDVLPGLWAKLGYLPSGELCWHSLLGHAADAGAVAEALLENPVLRQRLARLANQDVIDDVIIEKLCGLIALHDLGKSSRGFQQQVLTKNEGLLKGHCQIVLGILDIEFRSATIRGQFLDAIGLEAMVASLAGGDNILFWEYLSALMAHHGSPISEPAIIEARGRGVTCWTPTETQNPIEDVRKIFTAVQSWYPRFLEPGSLPSSPAFIHAFAGLVTLADWIASDAQLFFMDNGPSNERIQRSRDKARNIVDTLGLSGHQLRQALEGRSLHFFDLFEKHPRPAQQFISEFDDVEPGSVVVLEAETGSGKTEAAFRHFLGLHQTGAVDGLYFALPLRTAAVQIAERLKNDFKRIAPNIADHIPVVTAVPGYTPMTQEETSSYLLPQDSHSPVVSTEGQETVRPTWASDHPKRYLAATLAVGTIDQALLSVLRVRHTHLRASAHLRQLLVVDEVHASDVYMRELLRQLVNRHRQAGGHVLLMSATLGSSARNILLEESTSSFEEATAYPYPALSSTNRAVLAIPRDTSVSKQKRVHVELLQIENSVDPIIQRVADAVATGARVLVLRNRVTDAIATQRALEAASIPTLHVNGVSAPHHSRFAREDRQQLDRAILGVLGPSSRAPVVVVATQTAEQSLDIDADLMVTDLAPADVLLQRLGRLHRHSRSSRPSQYETPKLILLTPPPTLFDEQVRQRRAKWRCGWGSVYPNLVALQATLDAISGSDYIEIPSMNRLLVEKATHIEWLMRVAQERDDAWVTHLNQFRGKGSAERGLANTAVLDWNVPFSHTTLGVDELERKLTTRLGEQDRLAIFTPPVRGIFQTTITQLRISGWMCRDSTPDACVSDLALEDGVLRFSFAPHTFIYDRFGLRPETDTVHAGDEREDEAGVE